MIEEYPLIDRGVLTKKEVKKLYKILKKLRKVCPEGDAKEYCDGCHLWHCGCIYDNLNDTLENLERDYKKIIEVDKNDVE